MAMMQILMRKKKEERGIRVRRTYYVKDQESFSFYCSNLWSAGWPQWLCLIVRPITTKWMNDIKKKPNDQIGRFKALLVVRGISQRKGIDYKINCHLSPSHIGKRTKEVSVYNIFILLLIFYISILGFNFCSNLCFYFWSRELGSCTSLSWQLSVLTHSSRPYSPTFKLSTIYPNKTFPKSAHNNITSQFYFQ